MNPSAIRLSKQVNRHCTANMANLKHKFCPNEAEAAAVVLLT